jgi:tetratricopeptide (TPR) repeat protein
VRGAWCRVRRATPLLAIAVAIPLIAPPIDGRQPAPAQHFSGLSTLGPAYELILDGRFEAASKSLQSGCGPAPAEACRVLDATRLWWRILQDTRDTSFDPTFLAAVDGAIRAAEAWVAREPNRAEAWFYLGAAYGARVSWRVERGERLAAARDGKRIKESLERALAIDPTFDDARFGIGLYKYYADIAPAPARFVRFLLLLPGGDKVEGLRDMQASESRGQLVAGEALYQLHWIYLWYENQPERGRAALERLHARYPHNPHFLQRLADVEREYFHDRARSLAAWRRMVVRASGGDLPQLAEARGRLGAADDLDALFETDRAIEEARRVVALAPSSPLGATARAHLRLATLLDRVGVRDEAMREYRAAITAIPAGDPDRIRRAADAGLRAAPPAAPARAYRLSLEGWRAFERGDGVAARRLLAEARLQSPTDAMIRTRWARAHAAEDPAGALAELEAVIAARPAITPVALSAAFLWSADLLARKGSTAAARDRYVAATRVFAGDSRRAEEARRALEKQ